MAYEFRFPDVGEGIVEGEIVEWKVRPGDVVAAHDTLVVVETDKAVVEIPAPVGGTVLETRGEPGGTVAVGAVLAVIDESEGARARSGADEAAAGGGAGAAATAIPGGRPGRAGSRPDPTPVRRPSVGVVGQLEEAPEEEAHGTDVPEPGAPVAGAGAEQRARVLPRDRQLARRLGVAVDALRGTGPAGRVTEADVRRAAAEARPGRAVTPVGGAVESDAYGLLERVPLRGVRRRVARAMVESLAGTAQVTTTDVARAGLVEHIRAKERQRAADQGVKLTLLAFVLKAVAAALQQEPWLNASFDEAGQAVLLKRYYHLGVAVETRDGLLVPVVREVDRKSVLEVARDLQDLARRARLRSLALEELRGGTFTVSNYGSIGGRFATPILNPGEVGLLGVGRAHADLLVEGDSFRPERFLPLSLTFDHQVVDGATAQHFLTQVVRNLEDPDRFLVG